MIMIDDDKFYKKTNLKCFPEIKNNLLELHKNKLFPIRKQAVRLHWSRENFLDLFDDVNEIAEEIQSPVLISKFFITPKHNILGTHIDSNKFSPTSWALNIPILTHQTDHYMVWYNYDGEIQHFSDSYNDSIRPASPELLKPVEKLVVNEPYFVKIGIFHGVLNSTPTPRIMLSIRFKKSFFND